jgi:clan AA aspartic protease (TIGR02281 family)
MMRLETPFVLYDDLIIVDVRVAGPRGGRTGRFVLDTGAVATTMVPELAESIGYSPRDGLRRTQVRTAVGEEEGYILRISALTALGFTRPDFAVHVFDLGHDDLDGLLGLNFLSDLDYEIRSAQRRVLAAKTAA